MEMHQVRYFLSMARMLNFTRAADECNVSQPSLTRAIQKLEEEFGGPLFRRERARTHLTDLGRLMLPHLERTFEAAHAAKALAKSVGRAQVAPLALGVADAVETPALEQVLLELGEGLPGFALQLHAGSSAALLERALAGELDLVVVEAPAEDVDRLEAWPLFEDVYRMVVRDGHPRAGDGEVELGDVAGEAWIDCGGPGFAGLRRAADDLGLLLNVRHRADGSAQLRRLVLVGMGCAFVAQSGGREGLRALKVRGVPDARAVVLAAISGRRRSAAAEAFIRASRARGWKAG